MEGVVRLGGLSLLSRTSSRKILNLAAWHQPGKLLWSWCLSASLQPFWTWKPYAAYADDIGVALGLGQAIGIGFLPKSNGWEAWVALGWVSVSLHRQRAMIRA